MSLRTGAAIARAAEALIGTPFRLHGRDPATGLDCVGLVAAALAGAGLRSRPPEGYTLRALGIERWLAAAEQSGLVPVKEPSLPGDILLLKPGPGQFHLALVSTCGGSIHAHAGLGRVVLQPGLLPWPRLGHWRHQLSRRDDTPWQQ